MYTFTCTKYINNIHSDIVYYCYHCVLMSVYVSSCLLFIEHKQLITQWLTQHTHSGILYVFYGLKCFCVLVFLYVFVRFFHFSISCLYLSYCVCMCHFVVLIKSLIVTLCCVGVIVCVCHNLSLKRCINILCLRFGQMINYKTVNENMNYFLHIYIRNFTKYF